MSILSKLLLSFMRCYFLSLPFFSAGHVNTLLFIKIGDNSRTAAKSQGSHYVLRYIDLPAKLEPNLTTKFAHLDKLQRKPIESNICEILKQLFLYSFLL